MKLVKYPRTFHLPWSLGVSSDDKVLQSVDSFENKRVIVTLKMDGENNTTYKNYFHARSLDSQNHESRNWAKKHCASFQQDIPTDWRVCFENLYAKHSIHYNNLSSYINGISIWNDKNNCLSWDETLEWFQLFNIESVPILYDGIFNIKKIRDIESNMDFTVNEGYVIRLADGFNYNSFKDCVAKFVRNNHVAINDKHWRTQKIVKNVLTTG